ncbi:transglycosylase domain-containing protein [Crossiella sp. CA198]|uniref:transglycosylase domain-containing protein n=1 Tax=Crossiella sp. CA198 TaxID=3455607 RepID=UPI003F8D3903
MPYGGPNTPPGGAPMGHGGPNTPPGGAPMPGGRPPGPPGQRPPFNGGPGGPGGLPPRQQHPGEAPTDLFPPVEDDPYPREPELLTHREPLPGDPDYDDSHVIDADAPDPEEERKLRKKKIWRRVRRTSYVLAGLAILAPVVAFIVAYQFVTVLTPEEVFKGHNQVVTINYADGSELAKVVPKGGERVQLKFDEIPQVIKEAVLSTEDKNFYENPGFDPIGILRAVFNNLTGGTGGGSGITQQYIKISTGDDAPTLTRKFTELVKSAKMDAQYSKPDILTNYLNVISFGRGAEGIEAAAKAYFNKSAKEINRPEEAALLAAVIQRPYEWDPAINREKSVKRWNDVLDKMVENDKIKKPARDQMQFPEDGDQPGQLRNRAEAIKARGGASGPKALIQQQIETELERKKISMTAAQKYGYTITTTIDKKAQEAAEAAVQKVVFANGQPDNLRSALVATDPKTGGVLAYYGSKDGKGTDYAKSAQPPGSSFKAFVVAAALEKDIGLGSTFDSSSPRTFAAGRGSPGYTVSNASRGYECTMCSIRQMTEFSVNTAFVDLALKVGTKSVATAAQEAGIPAEINGKPSLGLGNGAAPPAGIALGSQEVRTMDMSAAYATFANDGMKNEQHFVAKVVDAAGKTLHEFSEPAKPAFDQSDKQRNTDIARNVTEALKPVAGYSRLPLDNGRPSAAKTGTHQYEKEKGSSHNSRAWMVGYTPSISTAVWVGTDYNEILKGRWNSQTGKLVGPKDMYGKDEPGAVWKEFMDTYLNGTKSENFAKANPIGQFEAPPSSTTASSTSATSSSSVPPTSSEEPTNTKPTNTRPTPTCGGWPFPSCKPTPTGTGKPTKTSEEDPPPGGEPRGGRGGGGNGN